jgi:predicted O-methyltransferase YrrM
MTASRIIRGLVKRVPNGRKFLEAYDLMAKLRDSPAAKLSGHYYSPIPSLSQISADRDSIFAIPEEILGIDLNGFGQRAIGMELAPFVASCPFPDEALPPWRYCGENDWFPWGDGVVLNALIRKFQPSRILEVGSGFSSAAILDTIEHDLPATRCTFIEPNPERLRSLLRPDDEHRCKVIVEQVQKGGVEPFLELSAGDILLIDSSHVSKVGSDVNWLIFEVLPRIAPGVLVHVHDVLFPFEYPEHWFKAGYSLNEAYLLRAFLMFNCGYEILFWNDYMKKCDAEWLKQNLPSCLKGPSTSIWLRVTKDKAFNPVPGLVAS